MFVDNISWLRAKRLAMLWQRFVYILSGTLNRTSELLNKEFYKILWTIYVHLLVKPVNLSPLPIQYPVMPGSITYLRIHYCNSFACPYSMNFNFPFISITVKFQIPCCATVLAILGSKLSKEFHGELLWKTMKEFLHVPDTADLWVGNIVWRDQDVITRPIGDYLYDVDLSKIDSQEIKQNEQQDNTLDFALKQFF